MKVLQACGSPGLLHFALGPLALVVGDVAQRAVDGGEVWFAHVQEVRPHAAHRHLGDVGERLADGAAEDEHAHLLVERRDVGVPHEGLGALVQEVDPVALADDDLKETQASPTSLEERGDLLIDSGEKQVGLTSRVRSDGEGFCIVLLLNFDLFTSQTISLILFDLVFRKTVFVSTQWP